MSWANYIIRSDGSDRCRDTIVCASKTETKQFARLKAAATKSEAEANPNRSDNIVVPSQICGSAAALAQNF
jgi:hypothetical protein